MLQPSFKQSLSPDLVSSEDDLGPEIILNLKWLDVYRYQQKAVFLYLDLIQQIKERYSWTKVLNNPVEDVLDGASPEGRQDPLIDGHINVNFNEFRDVGIDSFPDYIRQAPYIFTILNRLLTECKFSQDRERSI